MLIVITSSIIMIKRLLFSHLVQQRRHTRMMHGRRYVKAMITHIHDRGQGNVESRLLRAERRRTQSETLVLCNGRLRLGLGGTIVSYYCHVASLELVVCRMSSIVVPRLLPSQVWLSPGGISTVLCHTSMGSSMVCPRPKPENESASRPFSVRIRFRRGFMSSSFSTLSTTDSLFSTATFCECPSPWLVA